MGEHIRIIEVGPRDGLQNEPAQVPFEDRLRFIRDLIASGIRELEVGSFVRPDRVPRMADTDKIYDSMRTGGLDIGDAKAWSLVPNRSGLDRAVAAGAKNIALFTAATDSFARANIGMSIEQSIKEFDGILQQLRRSGNDFKVRGYVAVCFGCPFEGKVRPEQVLRVIEDLLKVGMDEISICDTIGVATPGQVDQLVVPALKLLGNTSLANHFHDTRGTALANALRAVELGVRALDSSAGGLGGCPFAPEAGGNLATEDLVYMLEGMGFETGIRLDRLCEAGLRISRKLKKRQLSKYLQAHHSECQTTRR
ncbi:MAG TPA: hydroxymethylglutaryl-CoA lyase [Bdellovibrionota bacterium]|nr:hydroxymethylglutaryl-CoA lyase [Bdellovibrionota bacterium]